MFRDSVQPHQWNRSGKARYQSGSALPHPASPPAESLRLCFLQERAVASRAAPPSLQAQARDLLQLVCLKEQVRGSSQQEPKSASG